MASLFISYARRDGAALAERLEADLRDRRHEPWRDRAEIEGGDDWSREIERAIDRCDGLVALLTKEAYGSRICRAELQRALRKEKYVVPLLVQKDADRPLDLEARHYLDFTDPALYESSLAELLRRIEKGRGVRLDDLPERTRSSLPQDVGVRSMEAALLRRQASWEDVAAMAERQRSRFLESLAPRPGAVAVYEPALYVSRAAEERELDEFLAGDARALVVLGDMGMGKTSLLCHWSAAQAARRHAVFMFAGERLTTADMESELRKDLNLGDPTALWPALDYLDELAGRGGLRVLIVIDALNDFRGGNGDGQRQLLLCVDKLVSRLPGKNVRLVLTCSTPAWKRLDRVGRPAMSGERYHRGGEPLVLGAFTEEEAAAAFERYRARFELPFALPELPPTLAVRLRSPLILRLLADAYRPGAGQRVLPRPDTLVFRRYYEQRLQRPEDERFVQALVQAMYEREDAALPVASLFDHPVLGPAINAAQPDASYARLLDQGVLLEVKGEGLFTQDLLKFAYPLVGAYALATSLAQRREPAQALLAELVHKSGRFPLAWDAAVTLLVMKSLSDKGSLELYLQLAGAPEAALRELASDSLVRLDEVKRERAAQILKALLDSGSAQRQRTALRAAFRIGPPARELILRGALSSSDALRRAVRDSLYVIWIGSAEVQPRHAAATLYSVWRHAPKFTHELVKFLVERMSWRRPLELWRIMRFVLDWCITMYINHCDSEEVAAQTAEVFHDLAVNGLHLDRMNLGRHVDKVVASGVAAVFARPILEWMLQTTPEEAAAFFRIPAQERSVLARIAALLDPGTDLLADEALVSGAFRSGVDVYCGAAALAVAVHAYRDFPRHEPRLRSMFDALDSRGRIWLLMSFAVLLRRTPPAWTGMLEDMTRRCLEERFQVGEARPPKVAQLLLVPLGLAYGKQGKGMPLFEALAAAAATGREPERSAQLLSMLAPIGFYHPDALLDTLRPHLAALAADDGLRRALTVVLATMRTLHFDLVDLFMEREQLDEALRREVVATTDVALIDEFMRTLGFFNNAVHQCLFRPGMREGLSVFPLKVMAEAGSTREFIAAYAAQAIRMARQTRFRLDEWLACAGS
ncbi:MAG TPA: toll/interleukin-1 receptor domain-containing protein [Burkholderiales bacterium]